MKCVIFDLDGTLTDSSEGIIKSVIYALHKMGIEEKDSKSLEAFIGPPMLDSFMKFYHMDEAEARRAYSFFQERYSTVGKFENRLYDGIDEVLTRLCKAGCLLAVATSKPEFFARQILEHFNVMSYFAVVRGASMDGSLAKKLDILRLALEDCRQVLTDRPEGVTLPVEWYMVGDRLFDMEAAVLLDCIPLGVTYGFGSVEELEKSGALHLCQAPSELYDTIMTD